MGRARTKSLATAVAARNFAGVLGSRRGSADAQAQRDREEKKYLNRDLEAFACRVLFECGTRTGVDLINAAYSEGVRVGDSDHKNLVKELVDKLVSVSAAPQQRPLTKELAIAVSFGDPEGRLGLTAPAGEALGSYFANSSNMLTAGAISRVRSQAEYVIERSLGAGAVGRDLAYYERLRPLCEGMGEFLDEQNNKLNKRLPGSEQLFLAAAQVLAFVPRLVWKNEGPLASWIRVLDNRHADGSMSGNERATLRSIMPEVDTST